ncbi:Regulator of G-protein signaling loco [Sergentomyia squamirostris]
MLVTSRDLQMVVGFIKEDEVFMTGGTRALPSNSGNSPFRRWGQSSFRSRSNEQKNLLPRRPSSLAASESDVYTKSINGESAVGRRMEGGEFSDATNGCGVSGWSNSFERLLEDTAGLHAFAEFLKKEFSAENIYFWTGCERYRQIENQTERAKEAQEIFAKHLASTAQEPVNVDCQVRNTAEENLQKASVDLFEAAQKQIFNLMKFDSYARFIRSDLFKSCLEAEAKCKPLPYPGDQLDAGLRTGPVVPTPSKLKKSLSNAEDRRRKSLLPWHRKTRSKSKDRDEAARQLSGGSKSGSSLRVPLMNSNSDLHSSRSSLSSFDAAITKLSNDSEEGRSTLCRVILPDSATTIVQTRSGESIRELVDRLLEKRGLSYNCYEAFLAGFSKPLDLEELSRSVAGKEVQIEQRVVFKLDLPNRKVISVKSKPCKFLEEVLRPILHKYQYRLETVEVFGKDCPDVMDMRIPVTSVDGQRLQIALKTTDGNNVKQQISKLPTAGDSDVAQLKNSAAMQHHSCMTNNFNQTTLDEITNKVFNELLQGKVETMAGASAVSGPDNPFPRATVDQLSMKSEEWGSETSSGIFARPRRHELFPKHRGRKVAQSLKNCQTETEDNGDVVGKPLIAKWKSGAKLQVTTRSSPGGDDLLEGLKRAQRSRLEDQRGTEINFELPEFLRNKENLTNNKSRCENHRYDDGAGEVDQRRESSDRLTGFPPRPQPAPRLSIINNNNNHGLSPRTPTPSKGLLANNNEASGGNYSNSSVIERSLLQLLDNGPPITRDNDKFDASSYLTPSRTGFTDPDLFYGRRHSGDRNAFRHGDLLNSSFSSTTTNNSTNYFEEIGGFGNEMEIHGARGPPPLPPKPKVVPMKPSNWSQSAQRQKQTKMSPTSGIEDQYKMPVDIPRMSENTRKQKNAYFDQPSSSFV